jgi:hypothetical protein
VSAAGVLGDALAERAAGLRILAHGVVGSNVDLPVQVWMAQYGAAIVLLVSFAVLGLAWRQPKFEPPYRAADGTVVPDPGPRTAPPGRPLPAWCQRLADAPATRRALRALGLAAAAIALFVAAFGPASAVANPAPTWIYAWFWVGLVPLSLLIGPVWRLLNPLRTVSAVLARLSGDPQEGAVRPLPPGLGYWPAAAGLFAFTWLELAYGEADLPIAVLVFMVVYGLAQLGAATRYGRAWFERGDAFEAYSTVIGHLSPVARDADGRLVLCSPLAHLATLPRAPGMVAFVSVMLGSTGFDGVTRMSWWGDLTAGWDLWMVVAVSTAGLAASAGVVALTFTLAVETSKHLLGDRLPAVADGGLARAFAHSLVPIAVGYTTAHYFGFLLLQGQAGYILASDPLGRGWDLFGTVHWTIDFSVANPTALGLVQVGAIVLGHLLGAVAAHDRAVALYPPRATTRAQYALLAVMVVYTMLGIGLVVG